MTDEPRTRTIYHLVPQGEWFNAGDHHPYRPASLAAEGFIHCSPDEATTLAVADIYFADVAEPLLAVLIDESAVADQVRWEPASGPPVPGVAPEALFPHLYGPLPSSAAIGLLIVRRDDTGRCIAMVPRR